MITISPIDNKVIKVGIDALKFGDAPTISRSPSLASIIRKPSTTIRGTSYIDSEYNVTVFLLSNLYYSNTILRILRNATGTQYFESSPLIGHWYSQYITMFSNPSREVLAGKLPSGLNLVTTGPNNNRSLKVYGKIDSVIADLLPSPVKFDSYPIYNKGFVVRYHFIPPEPLTRKIYAIDLSVDWSDLRDSFVRQVTDQSFQDSSKGIITGDRYVGLQKQTGYYGD